jgi:pimeloyl-ACP methyl ester carboxylesterase
MAGSRPNDLRPLIVAGVPVLGIFGKQDRRFVGEAGYLQSIGAEVALIDRAGHFPFVEQPEEFHRVLESFLIEERTASTPEGGI